MKREIKFRGLRTNGKGWVYGHYYEYNGKSIIGSEDHSDDADTYYNDEVIPESVGQSLGIKDKNDKFIFEGDICRINFYDEGLKEGQVVFRVIHSGYYLEGDFGQYSMSTWEPKYIEVVGNIHDPIR
jgi:uncharacterized phage protein (TIGR01671 family)